jgi:hypothetical protein
MFKNKREKRYSQERLNNENGRRRRREGKEISWQEMKENNGVR